MTCRWLLPLVFLTVCSFNSDARNEVEAGAHELLPFRSSWFGSVEKSRQVEKAPNYIANNEDFAEYSNVRPQVRRRKVKSKQTIREPREENLKKPYEMSKKKKKKRKRKKKQVPNPRRFVKITNAEGEKESNMTDSIEVTKRSKPVDIVVHIKVSE